MDESMTEAGRSPRVRVPLGSIHTAPKGWPEDEPTPAGMIPMGDAEGYEGWELVVVELPEPTGDAYVLDCGPVARLAHPETYPAKTDDPTGLVLMKTRVVLRYTPWDAVAAALVAATDAERVADVEKPSETETTEAPVRTPSDDEPAPEPVAAAEPTSEGDPTDEELEEALLEYVEPEADGLLSTDELLDEGLALIDAARD